MISRFFRKGEIRHKGTSPSHSITGSWEEFIIFSWKPFTVLSVFSQRQSAEQSAVCMGWEKLSVQVSFKHTGCPRNIREIDYFCVMWSEIYASQTYLGDLWIIEGNFKLMVFWEILYSNPHHQHGKVLRCKLLRFNAFLVLFFSLFSTQSINLLSLESDFGCLKRKSHTMKSPKWYSLRRKIWVHQSWDFSHNALESTLFHSLEFGISKVE